MNYEIEQLKQAKQEALNLACGGATDATGEKVQTTTKNFTESKFVAYADYSKQLDGQIELLMRYRSQMLNLIYSLDNSTHRAVLLAYYINCEDWEDVATDLNYSLMQVYRLHGEALELLKDVI